MNRKRQKQIVIRLTEQEFSQLKKKVRESGLSQQTFLIKAFSDKKLVNPIILNRLISEISHIGNNLNQIAKRCNSGRTDVLSEVIKIKKELEEEWQQLNYHL
jgi:hypothetical protein